MSDYQPCWTNPHSEIDPLMRIRLLELQMATVAEAVRVLADAVDDGEVRAGVAKQVADLLNETHVPHL